MVRLSGGEKGLKKEAQVSILAIIFGIAFGGQTALLLHARILPQLFDLTEQVVLEVSLTIGFLAGVIIMMLGIVIGFALETYHKT